MVFVFIQNYVVESYRELLWHPIVNGRPRELIDSSGRTDGRTDRREEPRILMEQGIRKMTLAACKACAADGKVVRVWVQGHVVGLDRGRHVAVLDDGTATYPLDLLSADTATCGAGAYMLVIGNLGAPVEEDVAMLQNGGDDDDKPPMISVHQLIPLKDPNREVMWWGEMVANEPTVAASHSKPGSSSYGAIVVDD